MKKVSDKQRKRNAEIARIKQNKPKTCIVCMGVCLDGDLMHIFPKSIYKQYYTTDSNLWIGHRQCHERFDSDPEFRRKQTHIIEIARTFATEQEINRHFRL